MAGVAELELSVAVAAPAETVWAAATDWPRQGEWMLGTEVHLVRGDGGQGSHLIAFTGFGGMGFLDTMDIVEFEPIRHCRVRHTGTLINGEGGFRVVDSGARASTFVWWEKLTLPTLARVVWPVVQPGFTWGLRRSLTQFATFCEHYRGGSLE